MYYCPEFLVSTQLVYSLFLLYSTRQDREGFQIRPRGPMELKCRHGLVGAHGQNCMWVRG